VFFDAPVELSAAVAGALGLSTAAMMAAQILQAVLVALRVHRTATIAWSIGTVLFVPLLFLPVEPVRAAVIGQLAAPLLVVVLMLFAVRRGLHDLATAPRSDALPTH
jgi:O-antigen/teichoic acid export membrane protein